MCCSVYAVCTTIHGALWMLYSAPGSITDLHPVGEPVALGIGVLHGEQHVSTRDDAALWHRLDFDGKVPVVLLKLSGWHMFTQT